MIKMDIKRLNEILSERRVIGFCLFLILLALLMGNSYKPLIYKIYNDYEEVCDIEQVEITQSGFYQNKIPTGECVQYKLVRKTNVTPVIWELDELTLWDGFNLTNEDWNSLGMNASTPFPTKVKEE